MASSDDEGETLPGSVSNYHFVDDKGEPISFSVLPIQWSKGDNLDSKKEPIFLDGNADNGLQKIYKQVIAWKFDLSDVNPEISVLSKENNWIKLQKPRKSFEDIIRSILITVWCLHSMKKNPETSGKSLWDHLSRVFSLYDVRPSENDLVDHTTLISEAVKRDEGLAKSKFLLTFLEEKPRKRKSFEDVPTTSKPGFIVDYMDEDGISETGEVGSDEEEDLFDSVCSMCDNGGDLLCCEGRCMRSFHATKEAGEESLCATLGMSVAQVEAMQNFYCKNCKYKQHQCFSCGKLGSSDKSSGAEVFLCANATCGRFYHPQCVAKLLHREDEAAAEELQKNIYAGELFACPIHRCHVCKQGEDKKDLELQFAICRRCPKSYHRKCLPRKISFEDLDEEGIIQRAWDGLLPNRILIYCLKHEIDELLGTPIRDHIKFPNDEEKMEKRRSELFSSRKDLDKVVSKKRSLVSEDSPRERMAVKATKQVEKLSSTVKDGDSTKKSEKRSSGPDPSKRLKVTGFSKKSLDDNVKSISKKVDKSSMADENKTSLGEQLYALIKNRSEPRKEDTPNSELEQKVVTKKTSSSLPSLDRDSENRILAIIKESKSLITLEDVMKKHKVPSTHAYSSKNTVDRTITQGKVEGSIEALRAALKKLEGGGSIEDAKAVCEPEVLNQIVKWKNKLKVYLAPFLHGMRYTSFGRHFTKVDKLKEIVEKLHYYVKNGDTIVDFCCGANDFSCLMKQKLEEMGKKCSYKNYDVIQPKNDFNFEKRDWMSVKQKELPTGSQLIMGLNPPFGVKASLANMFINKALQFKPKLLILIVPPETERLDKKRPPYDLIWEDDNELSGKSFYLPGSVDVNDKQIEQWNVNPPLLYLWSRQDWTTKHRAIAQKCGHVSRRRRVSHLEKIQNEEPVLDHPMADQIHSGHVSMMLDEHSVENHELEHEERREIVTAGRVESSPHSGVDREDHGKKLLNENSKQRHGKGKHEKRTENISDDKQIMTPVSEMCKGTSCTSSPRASDARSTVDIHQPEALKKSSPVEVGEEVYPHFQPGVPDSSLQRTGYGGSHASIPEDMARRYRLDSEEPFSSTIHRWSTGVSPGLDYGIRNSGEPFTSYMRGSIDNLGYRHSIRDRDEYGRNADIRSQVQSYGLHDPIGMSQRSNYLAGQDPRFGQMGSFPSTYGHPGSGAESSYSRMNTSAMQRYAPQLDELNHTRMNSFGYERPMPIRNNIYDPLAPPRPGFQADSMGFAPGLHHPFSKQNSSGWLNE